MVWWKAASALKEDPTAAKARVCMSSSRTKPKILLMASIQPPMAIPEHRHQEKVEVRNETIKKKEYWNVRVE